MTKKTSLRIVGAVLLGFVGSGTVWAQSYGEPSPSAGAAASEPMKKWAGGSSVGMLSSTPDGSAFAMNGNVDYFLTDHVSIGPLVQLALTGNMAQVGLSGQGKYWITSPAKGERAQLYLQSGVGFVHTDFRQDDTSWLVPIGLGLDYAITPATSLTSAFLVNFTDLHTGGGTGADVMPGFAFGLRF